ncbi:cytochrome c551/c552 [Beggiatoa alba B18LD]|uniref:Cytochrome c551/c552 n=1 Tax=Beggiatoa alba B18LD TaxID=395493 RepID=I3CIE3_9GAMM|nr:hypothetical protein [Beggiatoa alba]EIJ43386.1 cytochrome c551/c552 [Beggiatoa alba B18LD]
MKLSRTLLIGLVAASSCLLTGTSMATETDEQQTDILLLISRSGCLNCHDLTPKPAKEAGALPFGPPYVEVAKRYKDDPKAIETLLNTVKHGSNPYSSHWKDKVSGIAMPPMVTVSEADAKRLLTWILALDDKTATAAEEQLSGQKVPVVHKEENEKEILLLISHSGCLNCHDLTRQTTSKEGNPMPFGPPYVEVAKRYKDDPKAFDMLLNTVKNGSNPYKSHWKDKVSGIAMPPMVTVSEENAKRLLKWILSLDDAKASHAEAVLAGKEQPAN